MAKLTGKVALVTGASRGVGKGIALSLGNEGATVYVTGRTINESSPNVPLAGSIISTAEEITSRGGKGIAVQCDHQDDEQVKAVFERIENEHGKLDILVNNAWKGYENFHNGIFTPPDMPFWKKPLSGWDDNMISLRWSYVASMMAIPLMIGQPNSLIVNISFGALELGNPPYNIAKTGTDRLTVELAYGLKEHHISVVSLFPGLVRTEGILLYQDYFDLTNSESPEFSGRAVVALATDNHVQEKSGKKLIVAQLAQEYDFDDIDGKRPQPIVQG